MIHGPQLESPTNCPRVIWSVSVTGLPASALAGILRGGAGIRASDDLSVARCADWKVRIPNDSVHTIVAAFQKIFIMLTELIAHVASVLLQGTVRQFAAEVWKVATYCPKLLPQRGHFVVKSLLSLARYFSVVWLGPLSTGAWGPRKIFGLVRPVWFRLRRVRL